MPGPLAVVRMDAAMAGRCAFLLVHVLVRVAREGPRPTLLCHRAGKIHFANRAHGHRPPVPVERHDRHARHRLAPDDPHEGIPSELARSPGAAVASLVKLGSIDPIQADALVAQLQGVAINDDHGGFRLLGERWKGRPEEGDEESDQGSHEEKPYGSSSAHLPPRIARILAANSAPFEVSPRSFERESTGCTKESIRLGGIDGLRAGPRP